ncbi:acetylornithine deacetylase [Tranquillimonas rosea]|uniref:acetylornithine deacetylase n=1 Tax=Tranquillimonas rosea TaxID=641238 RepID=UPI003BAC2885
MPFLDTTLPILDRLIAFPTVSADGNRACTEWLAEQLTEAGARIEILPDATGEKANLFATMGPEGDGGLVLSGHTDVVPVAGQDWSSDPFAMTEKDGAIYGRGSCDMKGFVAACTALAHRVDATRLTRPLHFAFTYDEEIGCFGGQALTEWLAERGLSPALTLVGEPTTLSVIEGHKGCYEYTTRIRGRAGHGSDPRAGVNAAETAAAYVQTLIGCRAELDARAPEGSPFAPPGTTINVGSISAGFAHNVIAAEAVIEWEMRPVQPGDAALVHERLATFVDETLPGMQATAPEAAIETETIGEVDGLEPRRDNGMRDLIFALTGQNQAGVVAFGTEAGLFQQAGMDVAICGPGSIAQAHQADEFVTRAQLEDCCDLLDRLVQRLY